MEKITRKSVLTKVMGLEGLDDAERAVVAKMIVSLDKRSENKSGKPTKKQIENECIKHEIAEILETEGSISAAALAAQLGESVPKVAALAKQMGIRKDKIKGKVFYMSDDFTQDTEENEDNE